MQKYDHHGDYKYHTKLTNWLKRLGIEERYIRFTYSITISVSQPGISTSFVTMFWNYK